MTNRPESRGRRDYRLASGWALLLGVLLLGPALGPGFVLTYDMVWVPDLALRADFLGVGSALPRAVPSDAVIAVLDEVIAGMLLQKILLLASLVGGGIGMARLMMDQARLAQLVAVSFYVWSPFVVERLVLGAWPVLIGYAVLPWLLLVARRWRVDGDLPASLPFLVVLGSLSAGAGLVTAVALLATVTTRGNPWRIVATVVMVSAANAPWIVSGLLHLDSATSDPAAGELFSLSDEGIVPGPLAALTGGGIWNDEVVPSSRTGVLGVLALVLFVVLAIAGLRAWMRAWGARDVWAWGTCFAIGWGLATFTWVASGTSGELAAQVPGGGLIRDGSRLLVLTAPLTAAVMGLGAQRLRNLLAPGTPQTALAALLVVAPILVMPDVAYGVGGRLSAVAYPASYSQARAAVRELSRQSDAGDVLLLPLSSYRQPSWNNDAKVLNPAGRYLDSDYVASDELIVAGRTLRGEDPRVPRVRSALEAPDAQRRSEALTRLGIGFVAVDPEVPVDLPELAGDAVVDSAQLRLVHLDPSLDRTSPSTPTSWVWAMLGAWSAFLAMVGSGAVLWLARRIRGKR